MRQDLTSTETFRRFLGQAIRKNVTNNQDRGVKTDKENGRIVLGVGCRSRERNCDGGV